ncbi:MAG: HlyC/CorC family transporter [Synoicihabitans sp.]
MSDASLLIPLFSIFALILASGFFSGSETGLTSISRAKIHKLKMEGNRRAIAVSLLHDQKEKLIGAILLGNNVVNIAASAIATALAISLFGEPGVVIATAVMTVLVLVFAEVLPKTYAVRHAEQVALAVAPILALVTRVLGPATATVHFVVDRMISLLSIAPKNDMSDVDVLRGTVEMYHEEGTMLTEDKEMLSGVFDLVDTEVKEVMKRRSEIVSININDPVESNARFAAGCRHSRIPVWEGNSDQIIGILHVKDLFRAIHVGSTAINEIDVRQLIRPPWFVPESTTCKVQLKAFQDRKSHVAVVVDEYGSVSGLVTLEDILEEVVGEIEDEHDLPLRKGIKRMPDGTFHIDGAVTLREINRTLQWNLDEDDATTLAGFITATAQCIPAVDEIFEMGDLMFQVLKREENRLTLIKVRQIGKAPDHPGSAEAADSNEKT